jgi:D-lactate dehydrogenase (cytochrome)
MAADGNSARPPASPADIDALIAELKATYGTRASTSLAVREQHAQGFSFHEIKPADVVVTARTEAEVQDIVAAAGHGALVIAYGTGTSIEGQLAALSGGVCINVAEMNAIIDLNAEDMDVTVEPGVTRKQLNEHLRDTGLFSPSIPAPTPRSAAWRRRGHRAPTRCATEPCAKTSLACASCSPTGASSIPAGGHENRRPAMI